MKKLLLCLVAAASSVVVARADSFSISTNSLTSLDHGYAYTWGINTTGLTGSGTNLAAQLSSGYVITGATITFKAIYNWDKNDTANQLFVHLLNDPKSGIKSYKDNPSGDNGVNSGIVSDYFNGLNPTNPAYDGKNTNYYNTTDGKFHTVPDSVKKRWLAYGYDTKGNALTTGSYENIHLTDYHDPYGLKSKSADFSYSFSAEQLAILQGYLSDAGHSSTTSDFGFGFDPDCHFYNNGIVFTVTTAQYSVPDSAMTLMLLSLGLAGLSGYRRFSLRR